MTDWYEYVVKVAGTDVQTQIEKETGINQSNLSRWKKGGAPTPAQAAKFAVSYGRNVLEAFVAAGFLTVEDAGATPTMERPLADLPGNELAAEVAKRLGTWRRSEVLSDFSQVNREYGPLSTWEQALLRAARRVGIVAKDNFREQAEERAVERRARAAMYREKLSADAAQAAIEREERIETEIRQHSDDSAERLLTAYREGSISDVAFSSIVAARYFGSEGLTEALNMTLLGEVSEPADTPELAAVAKEGVIEDSGENHI